MVDYEEDGYNEETDIPQNRKINMDKLEEAELIYSIRGRNIKPMPLYQFYQKEDKWHKFLKVKK